MKKNTTITIQIKGRNKAYSLEPAYPSGEFVIVTKFGSHVLRRLASWLANVIGQGGRLKT